MFPLGVRSQSYLLAPLLQSAKQAAWIISDVSIEAQQMSSRRGAAIAPQQRSVRGGRGSLLIFLSSRSCAPTGGGDPTQFAGAAWGIRVASSQGALTLAHDGDVGASSRRSFGTLRLGQAASQDPMTFFGCSSRRRRSRPTMRKGTGSARTPVSADYSLRSTAPARSRGKGERGHHQQLVAVDGRLLMLFEANEDEVFYEAAPAGRTPSPPPGLRRRYVDIYDQALLWHTVEIRSKARTEALSGLSAQAAQQLAATCWLS